MLNKVVTLEQVLSLNPCYSREKILKLSHGRMELTVGEIINLRFVPAEDKLWLLLREEIIPARTLHEFALWCAETALIIAEVADERSWHALTVKRLWLDGKATDKELDAAKTAARDAAWDDAKDAAWDAARYAAKAATKDATWAAAWDAARYATMTTAMAAVSDATKDTVSDATMDAALEAAWNDVRNAALEAARDAAWGAARYAVRDAQLAKLKEMLEMTSL